MATFRKLVDLLGNALKGEGSTAIANDTEVTVLADQTISSASVPWFLVHMNATPTSNCIHVVGPTDVTPPAGEARYTFVRKTNGLVDFRIRHNDGASRSFSWVVLTIDA